MAKSISQGNTNATGPIKRVKFMITFSAKSGKTFCPLRRFFGCESQSPRRAPGSTITTTASGQQYHETVYTSLFCESCFSLSESYPGIYCPWIWNSEFEDLKEDPHCVLIKPNLKPKFTSLPLPNREEANGVSDRSRHFILQSQKLSIAAQSVRAAKRLGRRDIKSPLNKSSDEQIVQTSTSLQIDTGRNEKDEISIIDAFGRLTIASWKCYGGKGKEWRKRPWQSTNSVHRGIPENFLKQDPSAKNHGWFSRRQPRTRKSDAFVLKTATTEAVADLTDVYFQWVYDDDEAPWPQEKANGSSQEIGYTRKPGGLDDNSSDDNSRSKDKASFRLPSDSYSGAIIGGRFRLDALVEEHETPGEKTYAVSDLMAPGQRLLARSYSLSGLPREHRDARKRHMKRLIRRENGCDVRQDGKIYIVYTCAELPDASVATRLSVHDRIRRGTNPPGSSKALQDDTVFPPLSASASRAKPTTFWEPSKVRGFFKRQNQKAPPTRPGAANRIVTGQVSAPKRKRHRWKKAKRHDPPEPCTAAEPKELALLAGTDETSGTMAIPCPDMVDPSFGCCTEMDKHLEINAQTIIAMAAEVLGCDLYAVRLSLGTGSWVDYTLYSEVITNMTRQELWLADQTARAQLVLRLMHDHFRTQKRREEIYKLINKARWMREQLKEKTRLEQLLHVRLMKDKEGEAKERIKVVHANICKELTDINVALEDGVRRKAEILAGGTAFRA